MAKLKGQDLLDLNALEMAKGTQLKEIAEKAGYFVQKKDGSRTVNEKEFYRQLMVASGIITAESAGISPSASTGRALTYRAKSNPAQGSVVISKGYLEKIGVKPGEYVTISVSEGASGAQLAICKEGVKE